VQAAFAVNRELILLYWSIGRDLSQRFAAEDWGGKIIDRLAQDLQNEFPGVEGFSPLNLRYMRSLAEAWPDDEILQQLVAKLPWSHNVRVLDRIKDRPTREWYLRAALEYGWSRDVLVLQDIRLGRSQTSGDCRAGNPMEESLGYTRPDAHRAAEDGKLVVSGRRSARASQ
jgi:predicted nuclease of restriction endonuclease-like (RecB) superfamily